MLVDQGEHAIDELTSLEIVQLSQRAGAVQMIVAVRVAPDSGAGHTRVISIESAGTPDRMRPHAVGISSFGTLCLQPSAPRLQTIEDRGCVILDSC